MKGDMKKFNERCVELFENPRVKLRMWHPRMFWQVGDQLNPTVTVDTAAKVDLCELEVLLSAAAMVDSECAAEVNNKEAGRADFIARLVREGSRPLLRPAN